MYEGWTPISLGSSCRPHSHSTAHYIAHSTACSSAQSMPFYCQSIWELWTRRKTRFLTCWQLLWTKQEQYNGAVLNVEVYGRVAWAKHHVFFNSRPHTWLVLWSIEKEISSWEGRMLSRYCESCQAILMLILNHGSSLAGGVSGCTHTQMENIIH